MYSGNIFTNWPLSKGNMVRIDFLNFLYSYPDQIEYNYQHKENIG